MRILLVWGLATAIAAAVSGLKSMRHGQRRRAVLTFAAAVCCAVAVCFILIRHGNVLRSAEPAPAYDPPPQRSSPPAGTQQAVGVLHETVAGDPFTIVTLDLRQVDLQLFWKRSDGTRFGTFSALADDLRQHDGVIGQ